ncbi:MAG TPA: hypothetical protein VGJ38_16355, partial [Jatrophihabitantaceae bacterium]
TGIVAFPLADGAALDELDDPEGTDGVVPVPPLVVVDVHPATSAEHATKATATANDLRKAVPSCASRECGETTAIASRPQEQGNPAHGVPE